MTLTLVSALLGMNGDHTSNLIHEVADLVLGETEREITHEDGTTVTLCSVVLHGRTVRHASADLHGLLEVVRLNPVCVVHAESPKDLLRGIVNSELDTNSDRKSELLLNLLVQKVDSVKGAEWSQELLGLLNRHIDSIMAVDDVGAYV